MCTFAVFPGWHSIGESIFCQIHCARCLFPGLIQVHKLNMQHVWEWHSVLILGLHLQGNMLSLHYITMDACRVYTHRDYRLSVGLLKNRRTSGTKTNFSRFSGYNHIWVPVPVCM